MKTFNIWYISSFVISLIVIIPVITVFSSYFESTSDYFELLKNTFLFEYISNSLILLSGVLILTLVIGVSTAYIVSFYSFPLSNFFKWSLILGFAVPPYIYAYSLTTFENYGTAYILNLFGESNYNLFIQNLTNDWCNFINFIFNLCLCYILTRASFYFQSDNLIELGKNLGFTKIQSLFKIIIPSARPAIVAGLSLVTIRFYLILVQ